MAIKDLTGEKFFNWKVISRGENIGGKPAWICECQCDKKTIKLIRSDHLKDGHCKSCGCQNINQDIKNKKFGKLTALFPTENRKKSNGSVIWHCKCDCGNECDVDRGSLISLHTTSCGCHWRQGKDITNQRFGKLIALYPTKKRDFSNIIWHCKCDCGNECDISINKLITNNTKSCGCLKSKGEEKIGLILSQNNIKFEREKTFDSCRFLDTNRLARFDFYLPELNICIEYDGEQHFSFKQDSGWNNEENYQILKSHDNFKTQWCKEHNIPLIRIPYTKYETLCIEDLLLREPAEAILD